MSKEWRDYPWVPYRIAHSYEERAEVLKVSKVARSPRGFMRQYEAAGSAQAMRNREVADWPNQTWGQRRSNFISRHLAQYANKPTYREWLALMMWAYRAPLPPKPQ